LISSACTSGAAAIKVTREHIKMPAYPHCLLVLPVALLLAACGTEGELEVVPRCPGPALGLDGDWFGTMEDEDGTLFTLAWEICGDRIVRETISGISGGIVGSLRYQGSGSFSAMLSDGTRLLMLTDPARRHRRQPGQPRHCGRAAQRRS